MVEVSKGNMLMTKSMDLAFINGNHVKKSLGRADGRRFEGFWENGKQHGKGKFFDEKGNCYSGTWVNGIKVIIDNQELKE